MASTAHQTHIKRVTSVVQGNPPRDIEVPIIKSWKRSLEAHQLDPSNDELPRVLPVTQLKDFRGPLESLLSLARSGIETLYSQIRDAGYVILLTDANGVTVEFIGNPLIDAELREAGLYTGACWSEEIEGTCAVGVCAIERNPVTVHHSEHFRYLNTSLTCSAAPIFAPSGDLMAILDASALHSPDHKRSQHLVLQMVNSTARMIENAHFLRQYEHKFVIRLSRQQEFLEVTTEGLIALEDDGTILAANLVAQSLLQSDRSALVGRRIQQILGVRFEHIASTSAAQRRPIPLRAMRSDAQCFALMRKPRAFVQQRIVAPSDSPEQRISRSASQLAALAGGDSAMTANVARALKILNKGIPVLLHGETGTGKEAFAKAMHDASNRAGSPFVAINCAAIPETLIESELFGYREGAFTGARSKGVRGRIAQADGGTLFLDEIGDMPLSLQTRMLRVLAEHEVTPLGAEKPAYVDFQVICATHRALPELVLAGTFRQDLYYRLAGLTLGLPALRERSDKEALIHTVLSAEAELMHTRAFGISEEAMNVLLAYEWPGNIRQLMNTLRSALALSDNGFIELDHLAAEVRRTARHSMPPLRMVDLVCSHASPANTQPTATAEAQELLGVLKHHHWNITNAAKALGASRSTIYRKMTLLGIVQPKHLD